MTNPVNSNLVELTRANYGSIVTDHGIVLVECWASSCGVCKVLDPVYGKVAEKYPQHTFSKLDTLAEDELRLRLEIEHVPTLMLYRDGILLFKRPGNFDETRLEDIIAQAESLDMDLVRADIEK